MAFSMSSFDGIIPELPGIAVDNFERCDRSLIKHLEDNGVKIYMSEITAGIIGAIPCYHGVKKFIKTLKFGAKTNVKLPMQYEDVILEVTLIPAGHCFGSVMFLFKTPFTTVLFTGDFRTSVNDVCKLGQLHTQTGDPIKIYKMYVDTTFMDCMYENFPKRSETVGYAIAEIKSWLDRDPENAVALHPSARFGYENLFIEIYKKLGMKVYVAEKDWAIYSDFTDRISGLTNTYETRIHKCSNRSEKYPHKNCVPDSASTKYLFVHLSAMKWDNINTEQLSISKPSDKRLDVCFATHCSRSEIIHFVTYFSPTNVVGFPNPYEVENAKDDDVKVVFKACKRKISSLCQTSICVSIFSISNYYIYLFILYVCIMSTSKSTKKISIQASRFDNPNYIRDRYRDLIKKPEIPDSMMKKRRPFNPAWMDYCDPYHCNDYHRTACGLNRKTMKFKWFQSVCHIILNNQCATYRGSLKFDIIESKYCMAYVMFLRSGCEPCDDEIEHPICAMSVTDYHVVLFKNICHMKTTNCAPATLNAPAYQKKTSEVTLTVEQRVNFLKRQIAEQIRDKQRTELILPINSDQDYSYVDIEKKPITPIMDFDRRKEDDKFRLREIIRPTQTTPEEPKMLRMPHKVKRVRSRNRDIESIANPFDSFYRRLITDENTPIKWLHCQDLITPFLSGFKTDFSVTKRLSVQDHKVVRLLQLLSLNTTGHTKDEIYSILYQISNIQIRLFQWDVSAITSLINLITKDNKAHTFKNIKRGVGNLLRSWHLDFGNTSNLLQQARIFRPPCVRVSNYGGSTKTSRGQRYTTSAKPKSTCAVPGATGCKNEDTDDDDDE
ncbi:hypothetical protein ABMA27_012308 [Loxostege sticticalis]|uniref:Uncharacterized protein n=1 Tax=Loxostege sticticalis TaxID=481309 RepID=A0ABR3H0U2_LOXSC